MNAKDLEYLLNETRSPVEQLKFDTALAKRTARVAKERRLLDDIFKGLPEDHVGVHPLRAMGRRRVHRINAGYRRIRCSYSNGFNAGRFEVEVKFLGLFHDRWGPYLYTLGEALLAAEK